MGKVLHASGSGYFPFCLDKGEPEQSGIDTEYPISLPLKQYMSWWWRVKTWRVTGSSQGNQTATIDGYNRYSNSVTIDLLQDAYWTNSIAAEQNLVCQSIRTLLFGFTSFVNEDSGSGPFQYYSNNPSFITFFPSGYLNGNTIYPRIAIDGWYNTYAGDIKVQEQVDPYSFLIIDGITIPCHIRWFPGWAYASNWSWSGSQSFQINPATYWPYE
jgi:hypothetical protein